MHQHLEKDNSLAFLLKLLKNGERMVCFFYLYSVLALKILNESKKIFFPLTLFSPYFSKFNFNAYVEEFSHSSFDHLVGGSIVLKLMEVCFPVPVTPFIYYGQGPNYYR